MPLLRRLLNIIILLLITVNLAAQKNAQRDSVVKELSAQSNQLVEEHGVTYRKVIGPARFLHNNTYLVCDTALWNVDAKIIQARGHVQIIQQQTVLKSDRLNYLIDESVAMFRGTLVQLQDKDKNTLRTHHLDYNTRDSVATFFQGGALQDKDGQIIESKHGTYDSKIKLFTFKDDVNMYTDSIFIKTTELTYNTKLNKAEFGRRTHAWKGDYNMLSANDGWYDRNTETFFFKNKVHLLTKDQEGWSDSLYYYRNTNDALMLGKAQILDTTRRAAALAGKIFYEDSLSRITLTRKPMLIAETNQDGKIDTLYFGGEVIVYQTFPRCAIDSSVVQASRTRLEEVQSDAVTQYRRNAAEAAAKEREEKLKKLEEEDPNLQGKNIKNGKSPTIDTSSLPDPSGSETPRRKSLQDYLPAPWDDIPDETRLLTLQDIIQPATKKAPQAPPLDSLTAKVSDSLAVKDSLEIADSAAVKDSTKIAFVTAVGNVKVFRKDMQVACDSLVYTDLDSIARLYKSPMIWQEGDRQYTADSVRVLIKNNSVDRANLLSNAFIVIQQKDTTYYDQIKGAEMMAFFDTTGNLSRFDAFGGSQLIIYLEENDTLATVNKKESKMLSAVLKEGNIERIYYFEDPKSDAYPIVQLPQSESQLSGFNWQPNKRPTSPKSISSRKPRLSQRTLYTSEKRPKYKYTEIYFPGHIAEIHKGLQRADSLKTVRHRQQQIEERIKQDSLKQVAFLDSLKALSAPIDSLQDTLAIKDAPKDSISKPIAPKNPSVKDTTAVTKKVLTDEEIAKKEKEDAKLAAKQAKEKSRKEKQAAREAKWKRLDERDAEKAKAKEEKKLEKQRQKALKILEAEKKRAEKEQRLLEKYKERFEKKKAAQDARAAEKALKKSLKEEPEKEDSTTE